MYLRLRKILCAAIGQNVCNSIPLFSEIDHYSRWIGKLTFQIQCPSLSPWGRILGMVKSYNFSRFVLGFYYLYLFLAFPPVFLFFTFFIYNRLWMKWYEMNGCLINSWSLSFFFGCIWLTFIFENKKVIWPLVWVDNMKGMEWIHHQQSTFWIGGFGNPQTRIYPPYQPFFF
jgi:hypothetical protein